MTSAPKSGLPPRIYLPVLAVFAIAFFAVMAYLIGIGFGASGSVFGNGAKPATAPPGAAATNVEGGGPPAAVMLQLRTLRERIAKHPDDDVAITQLADMYLAADRFSQAIPLYRQALKVNPGNVAARAGLEQARDGLRETQQ